MARSEGPERFQAELEGKSVRIRRSTAYCDRHIDTGSQDARFSG
jgi:hypothetical protein